MTNEEREVLLEIAEQIGDIAIDIHFDGEGQYYHYYCRLFDVAGRIEQIAQNEEKQKK